MTIQQLRDKGLIVLECITGSRAYDLALPTSDIDIRGVFILPEHDFYSLNYIEQVSDSTNDTTFYELRRFIQLLLKNNPNMLDLLNTPPESVVYKHPIMDCLRPELFLSQRCRHTFGGYAYAQIKKARGLNKKIVNPMGKERKTPLDFCYVVQGQGAIAANKWLVNNNLQQENCGLVNIPHMENLYGLYYDETQSLGFKGIIQKETSNDIALSSIPKSQQPMVYLSFNKDGYKTYCKDYREYWDWVNKRNEARYESTLAHGKGYDAKNMMHTLRLLDMAAEIATLKQIIVKRPNRAYLLAVRAGKFEYDELVKIAEEKILEIETLYAKSDLPRSPQYKKVNELLVQIRKEFYLLQQQV